MICLFNKISKSNTLKYFSYGLNDSSWTWHNSLFKIFSIWHGNINSSDSLDWSIQVEKCVSFMNTCSNFSSNTASWESIFNSDQSIGFFNTLNDSFSVQWFDCSQVDDFTTDSFFSELFSSL